MSPYSIITQSYIFSEVIRRYCVITNRFAAQLEGEHGNSSQITPMTDNPVEQDGIDLLEGFGQEQNVDFIPDDLYSDENLYADWVMTEEEYNLAIDEIHGEGNPPTEYSPCFVSQFYPYMLDETDCNYAGVIYYYHPDYLGNVEYITDRDGEPYQYFHYSAFGEAVVENKANTGTHVDYFRFNGKELDPETGNYYYGARYYDPRLSVWLSVDPLANKYPGLTPYNFVANNPVVLTDPDGRDIDWSTNFFGTLKAFINSRFTKRGRLHWKNAKNDPTTLHSFHFTKKAAVTRNNDGSLNLKEGENITRANPQGSEYAFTSQTWIYEGTHEIEKRVDNMESTQDPQQINININHAIEEGNISIMDRSNNNNILNKSQSYNFNVSGSGSRIRLPNERAKEFRHRVLVHEITHGLIDGGRNYFQNSRKNTGREAMPLYFEGKAVEQMVDKR